jgi:membrane fusion protein (multidrug efflux system)
MSTETPQSSRAGVEDGAAGSSIAASRPASPAHAAVPRAERAPAPRPDISPPAPPAGTAAPTTPAKSRRPIVLGVVTLAALALIAFGVRHLMFTRHHVSTDDAQVEGHIIPILPRVAGYVATVDVNENQSVRAGQTLVTIDPRDLRSRLAQAESDLAVALATAGSGHGASGQAPAQLQAARATVAQARANARKAESDLERYRPLAERNIVSRQQLDAAEAAETSARAQLASAEEQAIAASAAVRGAQGRVGAMRAARDQAALQLSYADIAAPTQGVVSRKSVEVGQYVQAGQPLMSVVPLEDVWVVANLKETEVRDITPGDKVELQVDTYPGRRFHGHVESVSPATGARFSLLPPDNATGNFTKVVQRIPVRMRIDDPVDPAHPLRPGMSARVTVTTS